MRLTLVPRQARQNGRSERHSVGSTQTGNSEEGSDSDPDPDAQSLRCTPKHPIYVKGRGWIQAEFLNVGDELVGSEGGDWEVAETKLVWESSETYNLEVADWHTFFVVEGDKSREGLWVHNANFKKLPPFPKGPKPPKYTPAGDSWRFQRYQAKGGSLDFSSWFSRSRGSRTGKPPHQAIQSHIATSRGLTSPNGKITEVPVVPGGARFADAAGFNPKSGRWEIHQIGGLNPVRGDPIQRERDAINDILGHLKKQGSAGQYDIFFLEQSRRSRTNADSEPASSKELGRVRMFAVGRGLFLELDDQQIERLVRTRGDPAKRALVAELEEQLPPEKRQDTDKAWYPVYVSCMWGALASTPISGLFGTKRHHRGDSVIINTNSRTETNTLANTLVNFTHSDLDNVYASLDDNYFHQPLCRSDEELHYIRLWFDRIKGFYTSARKNVLFSAEMN